MRRAVVLAAALAASPSLAASPESETTHVVVSGETLNGIANRAGVSASAISKANGLREPYVVRVGQRLAIPRAAAPARPSAAKPADEALPAAAQAARTASRVIAARLGPTRSPETATEHLVQPGETLGGIAARAKVPRILIAEANGLQPPYAVRTGQTLRIPRTRRHAVKAGDTSFSISMDYGVPWEQIALANNLEPAAAVKVGQTLLIPTLLNPPASGSTRSSPVTASDDVPAPAARTASARFAWPLTGPVRRGYASGSNFHDGLDITAPAGTMVRAAGAGTVVFAGEEKGQFGNLVVIDHGNGWHTAYGFLSRVTVKEGASVTAGERVGLVGTTGLAKGSELHFEVRRDGKPVDPRGELPKAP
ncbi:LysM peptidoglycan-binding domain-containing M23 family metallopeptidase [Novosphingobium panipatense]|uniref:Murein DD-endopeptidase MepM and murein hydrolase activator NlpD, contain LysM domain n=1 Tax=Novosphingobium panipatense TaxID=428991 RepID=A0ABY1PZL9_9SPHN|nr:LysM peptidoglycan-binding domain-containing M23 family metallopeptidase [Novosphingobium panipatense]SMP52090.1 Murein DD-endopeptidase MepM and murein hydrolase activator NlpD, contain LysM domain [Novosphingobium panipatense]